MHHCIVCVKGEAAGTFGFSPSPVDWQGGKPGQKSWGDLQKPLVVVESTEVYLCKKRRGDVVWAA